ncbi:MAG: uracil-DNA glycosylase [Planctomycetaceae bacterium]|nr:uracil-DNA glycosylase [Planctomycetaceae bacterium]MBT7728579.1 uracil-DNA glycosylase [Planctomycetaceae bacterium]
MSERALRQRLESMELAGVTSLPKTRTSHGQRVSDASADSQRTDSQEYGRLLSGMHEEVSHCDKCSQVASFSSEVVFGGGNEHPQLCFFGVSPEDGHVEAGTLFTGQTEILFTKILDACAFPAEEVYVLNSLTKPNLHEHHDDAHEIKNYEQFLEQQVNELKPGFICCLGASAAQSLLRSTEPIESLRKKWFTYQGVRVMCTYHPSYLLHNSSAKRDVWEDMKRLMGAMKIDLPAS